MRFSSLLIALSFCAVRLPAADTPDPAAEFQIDKVWQLTLSFTPAEYAKLEPAGGGGGPGGPGGPGGGRGGFGGPGNFLARAFMQADANQDGRLTHEEFAAQAEKWFAAWDKEKQASLTPEALRAGLESDFAPRGAGGPPGGGGGGPGGGRPGGGGMGRGFVAAEGFRNGMAGASGINFEYGQAEVQLDDLSWTKVGVRYKGNATYMATRQSTKRSFKLDLNEYQKGQKWGEMTKLNLHSDVMSPSWMDESLSYALYRDAGVPSPRTAYAHVTLQVPGQHEHESLGLYSAVEEVDKHLMKQWTGSGKGALFKPSTSSLFGDLGDDWKAYDKTYDPKTELTKKQKERVIAFAKLMTSASDEEFAAKLPDFLDIDEFSRYMAVTTWLATMDSILAMGQNFYVYLDAQTNRFQVWPWDLDQSFGGGPGGNGDSVNLPIDHPWTNNNRFLERIFKVPAFLQAYHARLAEFSDGLFQPEHFTERMARIEAAIKPVIAEESKDKLARFEQSIGAESTPPAAEAERGPGPGFPGGGRNRNITAFIKARAAAVKDQLAGHVPPAAAPGRGGFGRPGGPGGGFDPGRMLGEIWLKELDSDHDGIISHAEFTAGLERWFQTWDTEHQGSVSEEQIRNGLGQLFPMRGGGGPPGGR